MPSEVQIANAALLKLGEPPIANFTEGGPAADLANNTFAIYRDALLRSHPWKFALYRSSIAASAQTPSWEFTYAYPLPDEPHYCLRVLTIENESNYDWRVEGRYILTDIDAPLYIRYIQRVAETGSWDPLFIEALAAKLAAEWCEPITKDRDLGKQKMNDFILLMQEVAAVDGKQGKNEPLPLGSWRDAHV